MFNAAERQKVRQKEKQARITARDTETIIVAIMSDYNGRRWFYERFERGHIFSTPFSNDPLQMAFNCGIQNEALQEFLQVCQICPEEYLQMMREGHERQLADERRPKSGIDAERDEGNRLEAERLGIVPKREGSDGDEDDRFVRYDEER